MPDWGTMQRKMASVALHNNTGAVLLVGHLIQSNVLPQLQYVTMLKQMYNSFKYFPEDVKDVFDTHTRSLALVPCEETGECPEGLECTTDGNWCLKAGVTMQETMQILLPDTKKLGEKRVCADDKVTATWLGRLREGITADSGSASETETCRLERAQAVMSLKNMREWMAKYKCLCVGTECSDHQQCLDEQLGKFEWHAMFMSEGFNSKCIQHGDCKGGSWCSSEKECLTGACDKDDAIGGACPDPEAFTRCTLHKECEPGSHCKDGRCSTADCTGDSCPKAMKCKENAEVDEWGCCYSSCGYKDGLAGRSCDGSVHDLYPVGSKKYGFGCNYGTRTLCCPKPEVQPNSDSITTRSMCLPTYEDFGKGGIDLEDLRAGSPLSDDEERQHQEWATAYDEQYNQLIAGDIKAMQTEFGNFSQPAGLAEVLDREDLQARRALRVDSLLQKFVTKCGSASFGALLYPQKPSAGLGARIMPTVSVQDVRQAAEVFRCLKGGSGFRAASELWVSEVILEDLFPQLYQWALFSCPSIVRIAKEMYDKKTSTTISQVQYQVGVLGLMSRWEAECAQWPLPGEVLAWDSDTIVIRGEGGDSTDLGVGSRTAMTKRVLDLVKQGVEFYLFDFMSLMTMTAFSGGFWLWMESAVWVGKQLVDLYSSLLKTRWFNGDKIEETCMEYAMEVFDRTTF